MSNLFYWLKKWQWFIPIGSKVLKVSSYWYKMAAVHPDWFKGWKVPSYWLKMAAVHTDWFKGLKAISYWLKMAAVHPDKKY